MSAGAARAWLVWTPMRLIRTASGWRPVLWAAAAEPAVVFVANATKLTADAS